MASILSSALQNETHDLHKTYRTRFVFGADLSKSDLTTGRARWLSNTNDRSLRQTSTEVRVRRNGLKNRFKSLLLPQPSFITCRATDRLTNIYVIVISLSTVGYTSVASVSTLGLDSGITNIFHDRCKL